MDRPVIIILSAILILIITSFLFFKSSSSCRVTEEIRKVQGNSLAGLLESNSSIKINFGFYECNEVKKEDIIIYNFSGNQNPIIKIVKAVPGDRFQLQQVDGSWQILVNSELLRNSKNQIYSFNENAYRILSLYEKDYGGIIPEDSYLIFGNLAEGSLDSSHFGLISKKDILGKVIYD